MARVEIRWDSGVVVTFEGNDAAVQAEVQKYAFNRSGSSGTTISQQGWIWPEMEQLWGLLKEGPRKLLRILADQPLEQPDGYSAEELAEAMGLDGPKSLGGMFASIHRYANRMFPDNPDLIRRSPVTGKYTMPHGIAEALRNM